MRQRTSHILRLLRTLAWAGLMLWAVAAGWFAWQSRQAGRAMEELLGASWPRGGNAPIGMRERLLTAAEGLGDGDFGRLATALGPARPPSAEEQAAAERFLGQNRDARERMIATASAAGAAETDGADVRAVRDALSRALLAAADHDRPGVQRELQIAEAALDATDLAVPARAGTADRSAATALLAELVPGFDLARGLMTEGYTAAEKLLARASRHFRAGEFREAMALVSLAGRLLAIEPTAAPSPAVLPAWFEELARPPAADVSAGEAKAAVELCAKMAAAEALAGPLRQVVQRAGREMHAGRSAEAYWWATIVLAGLGMNREEIAAVGAGEKP